MKSSGIRVTGGIAFQGLSDPAYSIENTLHSGTKHCEYALQMIDYAIFILPVQGGIWLCR